MYPHSDSCRLHSLCPTSRQGNGIDTQNHQSWQHIGLHPGCRKSVSSSLHILCPLPTSFKAGHLLISVRVRVSIEPMLRRQKCGPGSCHFCCNRVGCKQVDRTFVFVARETGARVLRSAHAVGPAFATRAVANVRANSCSKGGQSSA